jgi:hypothetical protein
MLQNPGDGLADMCQRAGLELLVTRVDDGGLLLLEVDDS